MESDLGGTVCVASTAKTGGGESKKTKEAASNELVYRVLK